ncbi:hypothetical protein P9112_003053 [Eukaryota sp. TZLM1-RC]
MSRSHRIVSYLEPLLSRLVDEDILNSFCRTRGDLMLEGLEGTTIINDVTSTYVCKNTFIPLAQSKHKNPLFVAENSKIAKYKANLRSLNAESHTHISFVHLLFPDMVRLDHLLYLFWMILLKL